MKQNLHIITDDGTQYDFGIENLSLLTEEDVKRQAAYFLDRSQDSFSNYSVQFLENSISLHPAPVFG